MLKRFIAAVVLCSAIFVGAVSTASGASAAPAHPAGPCVSNLSWINVQISGVKEWGDPYALLGTTIYVEETAFLQQEYDNTYHEYCPLFRAVGGYLVESDGACHLSGLTWIPSETLLFRVNTGYVNSTFYNIEQCDTTYYRYAPSYNSYGCFYATAADENDFNSSQVSSPQKCI